MRSSQWKYWFPVGCFPVSLVLVIVMIMKGPVVRTGPMPTTIQIGGHEYEFPPEMIEQLISGGPTPMARLKFRWEDLGLDPPMRRENRRVMVSIYKDDSFLTGKQYFEKMKEAYPDATTRAAGEGLLSIEYRLKQSRDYIAETNDGKDVFIRCSDACRYQFITNGNVLASVYAPSDEILHDWPKFHLNLMNIIEKTERD